MSKGDRITPMEEAKHIAVCDDEAAIADLVGQLLTQNGYRATVCYSAQELLKEMEHTHFDLIILDIMMPGMDGFECCSQIRKTSHVPIIFLTAKDSEIDKVVGLELGADDYITKPFKPREFMARIKARLRRNNLIADSAQNHGRYNTSTLSIDETNFEARLHDEKLVLTPKEFGILLCLIKRKGQPVSSTELFETVWEEKADVQSNNTVMVHIRHLRKKLEKIDSSQEFIKTVWGIGYKVE